MRNDILLVDDDPGTIHMVARILSGVGHVRFATSGEAALRLARECTPDLVLLDAEMPGMSGYQVCETMKTDPSLCDVPIIFITGHAGTEREVAGLNLGASDFIAKPISDPLLTARVRTQLRVKHLTDELRRIATTDALTELATRRAFDDVLDREWRRGHRAGAPMSLLMVDVDHFKRFNDHYGHPAGDACLRMVAHALRGSVLRPADVVARYGGEEFVVLLPQTPREGAEHVARRVLDAVMALGMPHEASATAPIVTVSVGLSYHDETSAGWVQGAHLGRSSVSPPGAAQPADLVEAADRALYAAKHAGRARAWRLDLAKRSAPGAAAPIAPGALDRNAA